MRLYRCSKFTADCYPCEHRYRHSWNPAECHIQCQHDPEAKCELCEGDMYINEKRDMALAKARGEEYLDRMGKSIEDIARVLREQETATWEGFGALFTWAKEQDWWNDFLEENGMVVQKVVEGDSEPATFEYFPVTLMDPDEFADAVLSYLDEMEEREEEDPSEGGDTEEDKPDAPQGSCNGSIWSNCTKEKCQHYLSHDITDCKSHYCHDIKRMVFCKIGVITPKNNMINPIPVLSGNGHDVWST